MTTISEDYDGNIVLLGDIVDVPDYAAAAVVAGNGIVWDEPIWLADDSAAAMIEAGMIDADPVASVDLADGRTIHCYEKA